LARWSSRQTFSPNGRMTRSYVVCEKVPRVTQPDEHVHAERLQPVRQRADEELQPTDHPRERRERHAAGDFQPAPD
jgi:hypothetical protein